MKLPTDPRPELLEYLVKEFETSSAFYAWLCIHVWPRFKSKAEENRLGGKRMNSRFTALDGSPLTDGQVTWHANTGRPVLEIKTGKALHYNNIMRRWVEIAATDGALLVDGPTKDI